MPRPVHRNGIAPESRYPVIFRGLVKHVPPCCMIDHDAGIFHPKIICPRYRQIDAVDHILSFFIIKMSVLHPKKSPFSLSGLSICKAHSQVSLCYDFIIDFVVPKRYCQVWHNLFIIVRYHRGRSGTKNERKMYLFFPWYGRMEIRFLKKLAICIRRQTAPGGSHDFQLLYG